eukprot:4565527-Pyramimonas_sp.AAC.1
MLRLALYWVVLMQGVVLTTSQITLERALSLACSPGLHVPHFPGGAWHSSHWTSSKAVFVIPSQDASTHTSSVPFMHH